VNASTSIAMHTATALALIHASTLAVHAQEDAPEIRWEAFPARGADGAELDGMLGRITVPERHDTPGGATIDLAFVVFPSTSADPGPPIFFLIGGPGASGIEHCADVASDPRMRLLDHGDVIGIDQRGTGRTRPNISDGPAFEYELPLDRALSSAAVAAAHAGAVERCSAHWRAQGVDLGAYDSEESADDVDAVRRALGLDEIVLWGTSYGSHLGLAYLRRHAEHVARAVLMKVEGPDHTWKLPSTAQRMLEAIDARVSGDPTAAQVLPDFLGSLRARLAELAAQPVTVELQPGREIVVGAEDLRRVLAEMLPLSQGHAVIPRVVAALGRGEWQALGESARDYRAGGVSSAMMVLMDCASGASSARRERLAREAADPANLLGDALNAPYYLSACSACGPIELDATFRGPLACEVPVLFVSGSLDARTPPANVEDIRSGFARHAHVLVENTGHDSRELESDEYRALVHAFLRGEEVASRTITLPPLPLAPLGR
jgi:pimeloyl-ACP methyl ester carboxylesterase